MSETGRTELPDEADAHLRDVEDGCGCVEVWEHLSAGRAAREG